MRRTIRESCEADALIGSALDSCCELRSHSASFWRNSSFVGKHHRDVIFNGIHTMAGRALQSGAVRNQPYRRFTKGANENSEQFLGYSHWPSCRSTVADALCCNQPRGPLGRGHSAVQLQTSSTAEFANYLAGIAMLTVHREVYLA